MTTDATGNATIPPFTVAAGQIVTATATDPANNTSEFSACVLTTEAPAITLAATDPDAAGLGGNVGTVVVTRTGPTTADRDVPVNVRGTAFPGSDYDLTSPSPITFTAGNAFTIRILAGRDRRDHHHHAGVLGRHRRPRVRHPLQPKAEHAHRDDR